MKFIAAMMVFLMSLSAWAVTVEFPEEELARESVLPLFDNPEAVKSRSVPTKNRFEVGFNLGYAMNEPFFETLRYGMHVGYHFTENHGVVLLGQIYQQGINDNGRAIAFFPPSPPSTTPLPGLKMEFAPQPEMLFFANYQMTPYYGKISVTKGFIMNLSLYGYAGVGSITIGGETAPAGTIGIGQKFYASKYWGLRTDLGLVMYQGPNYTQAGTPLYDTDPTNGATVDSPTSDVPVGDFEKTFNTDIQFSLSLIFLI